MENIEPISNFIEDVQIGGITHMPNKKGCVFIQGKVIFVTPPTEIRLSPDEIHYIVQRGDKYYAVRVTEDGNVCENATPYFTQRELEQSGVDIIENDLTEEDYENT